MAINTLVVGFGAGLASSVAAQVLWHTTLDA